ncbi:MAG: VF530 family protein [Planctomycetota bacterium]|nr:VF530 family protein [Planctomycetota bacterium]
MADQQPNNPLHGITLKAIITDLVERRGWDDLAFQIDIRCFKVDPSIGSSLKFLRRTEWARKKVEQLYLRDQRGNG